MMVLWIRLTGSVFVSKMLKHDVSPREGLVTTDAKHDDQSSKVKSSSYTVSVSCKLCSSEIYKRKRRVSPLINFIPGIRGR